MLFSYNHLFVKTGLLFLPVGLGVDGVLNMLDSLKLDRPNEVPNEAPREVDELKLGLRPPSLLPLLVVLVNRGLPDGDSGDDSWGLVP